MTNSSPYGKITKDHQNILPRKHALNREEIKEIVKVIRNHMALLSILIFPLSLNFPSLRHHKNCDEYTNKDTRVYKG
jgi:hypothetical protein